MFPRGARPPPVASRPVPPARPSGEKILIKILIWFKFDIQLITFDQFLIKKTKYL